jgi:hypothetical protein
MSTRKKSGGAKQVRFPDFDAILGAFAEPYAMIDVSLMVVSKNEQFGSERITLRLGVAALNKVYNKLDEAIVALDRIRAISNVNDDEGG